MVGMVSLDGLGQCNLNEWCLHGMVWVSIQEYNTNATVCHMNHHGLGLFQILEGAPLFLCDLYLGGLVSWTLEVTAVLKFLTLCISCSYF